jgi:hypothetical protein
MMMQTTHKVRLQLQLDLEKSEKKIDEETIGEKVFGFHIDKVGYHVACIRHIVNVEYNSSLDRRSSLAAAAVIFFSIAISN